MGISQQDKATRFRALHDGPGVFIIPNPWDAGSARLLAGLGFAAVATSSAASANAMGRRDGQLMRDEALKHARLIVGATDLPVSADLENGFGDAPEVVAETIRLAADAGLACRRLDWFHIGGQAWFVFFVPGIEPQVDHLAALNQSFPLKEELSHYRQRSDRLERIESHVLYRLASGIRKRLKRR